MSSNTLENTLLKVEKSDVVLKNALKETENIRSSTPIQKNYSVLLNSSEESIIELLRDMKCFQAEDGSSAIVDDQPDCNVSNFNTTTPTKTQVTGKKKRNKLPNSKKIKNETLKLSKKEGLNGDFKFKTKKENQSQKVEEVNLAANVLQHQNSLLRNDLRVLKNKLENTLQINKVLNQQNNELNKDVVKIKSEIQNEKENINAKEGYFKKETLMIKKEVDTALEEVQNLKKDLSNCESEREKLSKLNLQKDEEISRLYQFNKQLQSSVERLLADLEVNHRHKQDMKEKISSMLMNQINQPIKTTPSLQPTIVYDEKLNDNGNMRVLFQREDEIVGCHENSDRITPPVSPSASVCRLDDDNVSAASSYLRDEEHQLSLLDEDIAKMQKNLRHFVSL